MAGGLSGLCALGGLSGMMSGEAAPSFSPADLSGLTLWLKTDSLTLNHGDPVAAWADSSGNGYHAAQSSSAARPTYIANALNGLPVVRFDGTDDWLNGVWNLPGASDATLILVAKTRSNKNQNFLTATQVAGTGTEWLRLYQDLGRVYFQTSRQISYAFTDTTAFHEWMAVRTAAERFLYEGSFATADRKAMESWGISPANVASFQLGKHISNNSYFPAVDYAELLVYSQALSEADRLQVASYLTERWGL